MPVPSRLSFAPPSAAASRIALAGLVAATLAMGLLHGLQPAVDPISQPVSFYIHGRHSWLLSLALGAFGAAALLGSFVFSPARKGAARRSLALFGIGILVTALVPSDRWFPWEKPPSVAGLIHAGTAMVAPVLLLHPMLALSRSDSGKPHPLSRLLLAFYLVTMIACGSSLAIGFFRDTPPPLIGLNERALALAALLWMAHTLRRFGANLR